MAAGLSYGPRRRSGTIAASQRSARSLALILFVTTLMGGCLLRIGHLQLVQGAFHRNQAEKNRIATIPIAADRGNIVDHKGRLLAANRLTRSVYLTPREQSRDQWIEIAYRLGPVLHIPAQEILGKLEQAGLHSAVPVRISRDINQATFVALAEQIGQQSGIEVRAESNRYYPNGDIAAHVLGYVGEASAEQLKKNPDYPMGMILGQMGIERIADAQLRGVWGALQTEVDATGQVIQRLETKPAIAGDTVKLTLDVEVQKTAEKALAKRRGAVVVMDVNTGAVLALVSGPTFDPNLFTRRMTEKEWNQLQNPDKPFLNRALQGYPPGSTFKIVTAAAGMQSGKFAPDSILQTYGALNIGGTLFHEHGASHGAIGFRQALAVSSNTFFYQIGMAIGPEVISEWAHKLGIGETDDLGLEGASHGTAPTPAEKEKMFGEPWYAGDTVSMSIGQGVVQMTPLEEVIMISAMVNGGQRVKPHLLASQTHQSDFKPYPTGLKPETIAQIKDGLIAVVQEGTAQALNDGSIPLTGGKTGTAEVLGQRDNSMYVGFGPANDPKIAIAVVVENGGYGAEAAVPIAHEVFKTYFGVKPKTP